MARARLALAAALLSAGCGKLLGIDDLSGPATPVADAPVLADAAAVDARPDAGGADAAPDGPVVPATITVSGDVKIITGNLCANREVRLIRADEVELARTNADNNCQFTLTASTDGMPLDVSVYAPAMPGGERSSRTYFPAPLRADRSTTIKIYSSSELNRLSGLANDPLVANEALVVIHVRDQGGALVQGATVKLSDASNARIHYGNGTDDPVPQPVVVSTAADGVAFAFNANSGSTIAQATKSPVTFAPRSLVLEASGVVLVDLAP